MARGRGKKSNKSKAVRDALETNRFFDQEKKVEDGPPAVVQALAASFGKCQDNLHSIKEKAETENRHILLFDEQIFLVFPRIKTWLQDEAKAAGRLPCDVLIAMMRASLDRADHFRFIKALCVQNDADRSLIESFGREIRNSPSLSIEDEANNFPINKILRDSRNDLCPEQGPTTANGSAGKTETPNGFRGEPSERSLAESDATLLKGIGVMASVEGRAVMFQSPADKFKDERTEENKSEKAKGKETEGEKDDPATAEACQSTALLGIEALITDMAAMSVKPPVNVQNFRLVREGIGEMPNQFDFLGVPVPLALPEDVREDLWFLGQTSWDIDIKAEKLKAMHPLLDCALHIWTSSMDHASWQKTKSRPCQLWRLPIVEDYLKVRRDLLADIEIGHMTDLRLMRQLNRDFKKEVGPALRPRIEESKDEKKVDMRWSDYRRIANEFRDMPGMMMRLEKYRKDTCYMYATFHALASMMVRCKKAGESSKGSATRDRRAPKAKKSPIFYFKANRQQAPGRQSSRRLSRSGGIGKRKRRSPSSLTPGQHLTIIGSI